MMNFATEVNSYIMTSLPILGSTKYFKSRQAINIHKLMVLPVYVYMIYFFVGTTYTELPINIKLLVITQSIYGFLWVWKDIYFPDPAWQSSQTLASFLTMLTMLNGFYYSPMICFTWDICPMGDYFNGSPIYVTIGMVSYTFGMFFHYVSDAQKHYMLKYQKPRQLITTGLFSLCRNPNYFGEILIKLGYGLLSGYPFTIVLYSVWWI
eukprot:UN25774